MIFKRLLAGMLCAGSVCITQAQQSPDRPAWFDFPTRALEASQAAHIPAPVLLWEAGAPNAQGDSDEDKPAIYPYLPAKEKATGCGIIVVPGGAFTHRAMDQEGTTFGKWFADRGIAAFVLRYRIRPLYNRADYVLDAHRSVQFVKARAAEYGVLPDRIGMIGFSAGADLTTFVAYETLAAKAESADAVDRQSSKIAFQVLAYGGSQPSGNIDLSQVPPAFLFCTVEDRGQAGRMLSLYRAYFDARIPGEIHLFPNGEHGVGLAAGDRQIGEWPNLMFRWIQAGNFLTSRPRAAVRGHVLLDGKPLAHGSVTFVPIDAEPANSVSPKTAFVTNTNTASADFRLAKEVGPAVGKYKVEIRQVANVWVSNARDPTRGMSAADKAAYLRQPGWGVPTFDGDIRLFTKARPSDANDLTVEVKPGENEFNFEIASK